MSYISALRRGDEIWVWERNTDGERVLKRSPAPLYFFVEDNKNPTHTSIFKDNLRKETFDTFEDYQRARQIYISSGIKTFESDLPPELKLLSQEYYQVPAPKLHVTFLDIEVDYNKEIGFSNVENPYAPINSIAIYHQWNNKMILYAVPPPEQAWSESSLKEKMHEKESLPNDIEIEVHLSTNEKELLINILDEIDDSDLLCGWNSSFFDVPYIAKRLQRIHGETAFKMLSFNGANKPKFRSVEKYGNSNETIDLSGRISADYLDLFKKYEMTERPSYKLESIADEILPELPKLNYKGSLHDLYRKDFPFFCRYNLRDTEILKGFEERLGYVALANEMYHLSTGLWKHVGGTLKLAELAINNYCNHELHLQFPDIKDPNMGGKIAGAYVLEPKIGMHDWVGGIDIESLYPSAIRSINISPEKIIGQFSEKGDACEQIANGSMVLLTLEYEDGNHESHDADNWRHILKERKWAISGYGTVFNQDEKGIIPTILEEWFATRKKYKGLMHTNDPKANAYYNRLQYVYKIKLNSLYGALTNAFFRYYDLRMGESTTGTGRMILRHQCAKANEVLTGLYDPSGEAVIYGDTDSTYFNVWTDDCDEAILVADAVAKKVNDSFQEFMQNTFLCQPGFDNIIKTSREVVASRGIFVSKKRYILRVIDSEGVRVDKSKAMGLDTKRTTIPPDIGKKLNSFIIRLLKGEEWNTIANEIVDYKEWVKTTNDVMSIGLPKGVQNVEDYTDKWRVDKGTRLPGHVAAAIHYNECRNKYHDNESLQIVSGMKIKVFYLSKKYGQFKSIALPTDLNEVPSWFLEHFSIHRNMHIERLIDNPLGNIIKAIGKEVPTAQSLMVDDLLSF